MSFARNIYTLLNLKADKTKTSRFENFITDYVPLTQYIASEKELRSLSDEYDLFIAGSDQIWNTNCDDFSQSYLLDFVDHKAKCCSYAPSIGLNELDDSSKIMFKEKISNYKSISVREETGAKWLSTVLEKHIETVLDPVFLISTKEWKKLGSSVNIKEPFVLGYYIGDVCGMRSFGERLAKKIKANVVVINKNLRDIYGHNKKIYDAGPREFVWLIEHADYICTNSFHAVAFSVIFKKKFWVFIDPQAKGTEKPQSRILDITSALGLEQRILTAETCAHVDYDEPINWDNIDSKLYVRLKKSKQYLENCLV